MLTRILALLNERGSLTVEELVRSTEASRDAIDGMLSTLQRKGLIHVQQSSTGTGCAGCGGRAGRPAAPPVVALTLAKNKTPGRAGGKWVAKTRGR